MSSPAPPSMTQSIRKALIRPVISCGSMAWAAWADYAKNIRRGGPITEPHLLLLDEIVARPGLLDVRRRGDTRPTVLVFALADARLIQLRFYQTVSYDKYRPMWANAHSRDKMTRHKCADLLTFAKPTAIGVEVAAQRKAIRDAKLADIGEFSIEGWDGPARAEPPDPSGPDIT